MMSLLRSLTRNLTRRDIRYISTQQPFYKVEVDNENGIATLTMQKPPANTLSLEAMKELIKTVQDIKKDNVKGMILASSIPKIFMAGLELTEMYKPDPERLAEFWRHVQDCWFEVYTTPFPTAAAITGHSPAAGCLLAMACEYRVMLKGNYMIGMNETAVGVIVPIWAQECFRNIVPNRQVEFAVTSSQLFNSEEALKINLVDELAESNEDAKEKCVKFIKKFDNIFSNARTQTKLIYRDEAIRKFHDYRVQETKDFVQSVLQPKTQAAIEMYLNRIKNKSK